MDPNGCYKGVHGRAHLWKYIHGCYKAFNAYPWWCFQGGHWLWETSKATPRHTVLWNGWPWLCCRVPSISLEKGWRLHKRPKHMNRCDACHFLSWEIPRDTPSIFHHSDCGSSKTFSYKVMVQYLKTMESMLILMSVSPPPSSTLRQVLHCCGVLLVEAIFISLPSDSVRCLRLL